PLSSPHPLSLHDALPILNAPIPQRIYFELSPMPKNRITIEIQAIGGIGRRSSKIGLNIASAQREVPMAIPRIIPRSVATKNPTRDRKSTRLNSSHVSISY